jgi:hypothetical protein
MELLFDPPRRAPHQLICTQLNLVTRCGAPPSRWKNGLQVLLEKVPSIALADKLCTILLMEGDFNFYNKWIFGHATVNKLYEIGYVPEDQYSKKRSTVEDSKLTDSRWTCQGNSASHFWQSRQMLTNAMIELTISLCPFFYFY